MRDGGCFIIALHLPPSSPEWKFWLWPVTLTFLILPKAKQNVGRCSGCFATTWQEKSTGLMGFNYENVIGATGLFFSCSIWLDSEFSDMLSSSFFPLPQTEGGYFVGFLCLPFLFQFSVCTAWCFKIAKEPSIYSDTQGKEIHRACCLYHSWCPKTPSWQTMSLPLNFPLCTW